MTSGGAGHNGGATATIEMGALAAVISPIGGVISGLEQLAPQLIPSGDAVTVARIGEVGALRGAGSPIRFGVELDGIGCHPDGPVAARIAAVEALERYSAAVGGPRRCLVSSAAVMGGSALDLSDMARCSEAEMAVPGFPLVPWDRTQPLRWVRGWSLVDRREVWVPAVMAQLGLSAEHSVERFWLQSSSGCAAAGTQEEALLSACFELIERDAVSIAWLQRLSLTRLDPADPPVWSRAQVSGGDPDWGWDTVALTLESDEDRGKIALFDATSDFGVPTALAVLVPPAGTGRPPAVGAGCSDIASRAALKALRELTVVRACRWNGTAAGMPPDVPDDAFSHLFDDRHERDDASPAPTGVPHLSADGRPAGTVAQRLARVVTMLAEECGDVVAVDLTPAELEGTGVRVVRVIAPALIPRLSHPQVRYLASRRLYEAPRRLSFRVRGEQEVNPWPSPL
jgi:ribosomal protein S12 methylthiotransferase accessory factor